jgi:Tfp pilus assembly protein PilF
MYRFLGLSQWAQGKTSKAVSSLKKAIELNERNTWAHIHLAVGKRLTALTNYMSEQKRQDC